MAGYFDDLIPGGPADPAMAPAAPPTVAAVAPAAPVAAKQLPNLPGYVADPEDARPGVAIPLGGPGTQGDGSSGPGHFDDLVPARMSDSYGAQLGGAIGGAWDHLMADASDWRPHSGATAAVQDLTWLPRVAGDVLGLAGSPVEGGVIQPAARLLDRLPFEAWGGGDVASIDGGGVHFTPLRHLTPLERHDANAGMLRTALAAGRPSGAFSTAAPLWSGAEDFAPRWVRPAQRTSTPAVQFVDATDPRLANTRLIGSSAPAEAGVAPEAAGAPGGGGAGPAAVGQPTASAAGGSAAPTAAATSSGTAGSPGGAFEFTPEQLRALQYVRSKMPGAVTPEALEGADQRMSAAEAIGKPAEVALGTLVRRPGATADTVAETLNARRQSRGPDLLGAFSRAAGIDASATRGAIDQLVQKGQEEARPLYEISNAAGPVWSERLAQLAQTNAGRQAVKYARELMSNELEDPNALGMTFVENPDQWATSEPPSQPAAAGNPVGFAGGVRGPARPPSQGPSLTRFIAGNGGINDLSGDVTAMGGDRWHYGKPFQRPLIGTQDPEDVAQRAWEAGYFPNHTEAAPSVEELNSAIGDEIRGQRMYYSRHPDVDALQRFQGANAAEEQRYYGDDGADLPHPDQYGARPEPQSEPALQYVPNAKTVDYIKRGFDQQLAPYYSGKLEWDDVGRSIEGLRAKWVDEAKQLNPYYAAALNRAGDYLSAAQAFKDGRRMLFDGNVDTTDFNSWLDGMTRGQRRAALGGMANRAYQYVQTATEQPTRLVNIFRQPLVQQKMRMAFGAQHANDVIDEVALQSRLKGFEDRWSPRANSATSEVTAEIANQDRLHPLAQTALQITERPPHSLSGLALQTGHGLWRAAVDQSRTAGMPEAVRDEAGAMLGGTPKELAQILRRYFDTNPGPFDMGGGGPGGGGWRGSMGSKAPKKP